MLTLCTAKGFVIAETAIDQPDTEHDPRTVLLRLTLQGRGSVPELTAALSELHGIVAVSSDDGNAESA